MTRPKLTERQERIYRFMVGFFARHHTMPTLREMGDAAGTPNPNGIRCHLQLMEKKGYLRVNGAGKSRSWQIVGLAEAIGPAVAAHLNAVLGAQAQQVA